MILAIVAIVVMAVAVALELKRDLMMLQQNSYRFDRYMNWLGKSGDTTTYTRLGAVVALFISLSSLSNDYTGLGLCILAGIFISVGLLKAKYKKPLVWTSRSIRIYSVAVVVTLVLVMALAYLFRGIDGLYGYCRAAALSILGCYCASHMLIVVANWILTPVESQIRRYYYNDAAKRLKSMPDLKIVGITGSYGKTSTKHYLYRILSEQFDTLMTPGSFNTTLGVVRTIREYLKPYNEVFIVEMGAKAPGDIKEICDLVHPDMGIITAVGPQHLESFKTIERVQATKFELADSLPAGGLAIVNNDFEKIADRKVGNCDCLRYGVRSEDASYRAEEVKYSHEGTQFTITGPDGWRLPVKTRLMGECNVSDLLAAAVAARSLGVSDSKIAAAIASIEPVEHRLSVKRTPGGITILDDAFNSNPVGSRMALEVLGMMTEGKRIVITPGMIELGAEQESLNAEFGKTIADNVDVAIVVGQYNRDAIVSGITSDGKFPEENLHIVDSFADAQKLLATIAAKGDTILYENDLPDTFK